MDSKIEELLILAERVVLHVHPISRQRWK